MQLMFRCYYLSESITAPSVKRRARFLFSASKCRLKKRSKDRFKDNFSKSLQGKRSFFISKIDMRFNLQKEILMWRNVEKGSIRREGYRICHLFQNEEKAINFKQIKNWEQIDTSPPKYLML